MLTDGPARRPAESTVVTAGGERRGGWKVVAAVAAVIAVVAVLGAIGGDGGDEADEAAERPTTTAPAGPAATVTTFPADGSGPGLVTAREGTLLPGDDPPVLVVDDGSLALVDLATGRVHHPGTPIPVDLDGPIVPREGAVVVQDRQGVLRALSPDLAAEVAVFGPASVLPAHEPDRLWLSAADRAAGGMTVVQTTVLDEVTSPPISLLPEVAPVGAVRDGLLLQSPAGIYLLRPGGRPSRVVGGQLLGAGGTMVARYDCDDVLVCNVHVTDLDSGADIVPFLAEEGDDDGVPRLVPGVAAFSPDASLVAMTCACVQGEGLAVVDTATGDVLVQAPFLGSPRWSPDGEWLFATSAGLVYAWPAAGGDLRPLDVTLRGAQLLAALPAAPAT